MEFEDEIYMTVFTSYILIRKIWSILKSGHPNHGLLCNYGLPTRAIRSVTRVMIRVAVDPPRIGRLVWWELVLVGVAREMSLWFMMKFEEASRTTNSQNTQEDSTSTWCWEVMMNTSALMRTIDITMTNIDLKSKIENQKNWNGTIKNR